MIRNATINVYDVLDEIWVAIIIQTREPNGEDFETTSEATYLQVTSTGQDTAGKWLREALMVAVEAL